MQSSYLCFAAFLFISSMLPGSGVEVQAVIKLKDKIPIAVERDSLLTLAFLFKYPENSIFSWFIVEYLCVV